MPDLTMQEADFIYRNKLSHEKRQDVAAEYNRSMEPYMADDSDDPGSAVEDMFWIGAVESVWNGR